jgi:Sugar (pentulose and hexulose) kinases
MVKTVCELAKENGHEINSRCEIAATVYQSLALGYLKALEELEALTDKRLDHIAIVGGGSKDGYLCSLTAQLTGRRVSAGPVEGTAIGNMLSQALATGELKDKKQLQEVLLNSIEIREYRGGGNNDKV